MFKESVQNASSLTLQATLEDIKKRIGDGVLSGDDHYVAEQKEKGKIVQEELLHRMNVS